MGHTGTPSAGAQLREWRNSAKLTQADLAWRAHLPQSLICEIERGKRAPSLAAATVIEAITGIPMRAWHHELYERARRAA